MDGVGYCKFCGQSRMVRYTDELTQKDIDRLATEACRCEAAVQNVICMQKARNARYTISKLIDPYSESAGKAMRWLADAVARDRIKSVTIRIDDRFVAKMAAGNEISVVLKETNVATQADVTDIGEDAKDGLKEIEEADE